MDFCGYVEQMLQPSHLISASPRRTCSAYINFFRNLVADSLDNEDFKIRGPGIIVEIDESKFGKRKYHHGHRVEGAWVFGGVERTEERKRFLVQVPDQSANTLLSNTFSLDPLFILVYGKVILQLKSNLGSAIIL